MSETPNRKSSQIGKFRCGVPMVPDYAARARTLAARMRYAVRGVQYAVADWRWNVQVIRRRLRRCGDCQHGVRRSCEVVLPRAN